MEKWITRFWMLLITAMLALGASYVGPERVAELFEKQAAPTTTNDFSDGYEPGDLWFDDVNNELYICMDATEDAADWDKLSGTDSTADDLVVNTITAADVSITDDLTVTDDADIDGVFTCDGMNSGISELGTWTATAGYTIPSEAAAGTYICDVSDATSSNLSHGCAPAGTGVTVTLPAITAANSGLEITVVNSGGTTGFYLYDSAGGFTSSATTPVNLTPDADTDSVTVVGSYTPTHGGVTWYVVSAIIDGA